MKFQQIFYIALCVLLGLTCVLAEPEPEPQPGAIGKFFMGLIKTGSKAIVKTGRTALKSGGQVIKKAAVKGGKLAVKTGKEVVTDAAVEAIQQLPQKIGDAINGNQEIEE